MINRFIGAAIKILVIIFWIIIFLAIFLPNSVDYWLPHSQVWEDQGMGLR